MTLEGALARGETVKAPGPAPRKDVRVSSDAGLCANDVHRHLGQDECASRALLALFGRDTPDALFGNVRPPHRRNFLAPLSCQERQSDDGSEGAARLGLAPEHPDLIIVQDA